MSDDQLELRRAFACFLTAKRALGEAYKKAGASHGLIESIPALERGDADQGMKAPPSSGKLEELRDENQRLRRLISLLHAYSLNLLTQRDTVTAERDRLFDGCEATACRMRENVLVDADPGARLE